jgi:GNAT superfamily N-acetyltransferase
MRLMRLYRTFFLYRETCVLTELQPTQYDSIRARCAGLADRVAIGALLDRRADGRIFVDDPAQPTGVFFWNDFRFSYLLGDPADGAFVADVADLLAHDLLPAARDSHDPSVVIYPHPVSWSRRLPDLLDGRTAIALKRRIFSFEVIRFGRLKAAPIPAGMTLRPIDADRIADSDPLAAEIDLLWTSREAFLADGGGFCLVQDGAVVSACLTAFAAGQEREISIHTHPAYRGRGLASVTGAAFIADCVQRGLTPVWECWHDNAPSVALAAKLGFVPVADYPVYYLDLTTQPEQSLAAPVAIGGAEQKGT